MPFDLDMLAALVMSRILSSRLGTFIVITLPLSSVKLSLIVFVFCISKVVDSKFSIEVCIFPKFDKSIS